MTILPLSKPQLVESGPDQSLSRTTRKRQLGYAAGLALVGAILWVPLAPMGALLGWALPIRSARRQTQDRRRMIITELPDIIDLFDVAFAANMNLHLSVQAVGETATGNIASELRLATERYYDGLRMREALDLAVDELGDEVRPLVRLLCDTSMSPEIARLQLAVLSLEARNDRRRQAEIAARKVPVKLLLPLVFNVLPAFGLLTVVPVVIGSLQQIRS